MWQLSIDRASVGYSTVGIEDYVNQINIQVVDRLIEQIHKQIPTFRTTVDTIWVGQSAEAFKDRFEEDSKTVIETLNTLKEYFESEIAQIGKNVDNYDDEIAQAILNGDFSGVQMSNSARSSVTTNGSFSSYKNNKEAEKQQKIDNVASWWDDVSNNAEGIMLEVGNTMARVGATVVTASIGPIEGVGEFLEALVDLGALVGGVIRTPYYAAVDGVHAIQSKITGTQYNSALKEDWDYVKAFVQEDYVNGWFDAFYNDTAFGQAVKENTYGFDTVRGVTSGLGYTAGVVGLSIATFGVGGVAVGGTAGAASAATAGAGTTLSTTMALVGGAAGVGRGTETAWANGATLSEGLVAGAASGAWEGIQFYIGGQINGLNVFDSALANVGTRIGLDTLTGAVETPVQAAISAMYKDGYYDANGNYVAFKEGDSVLFKYGQMFNDEGGVKGMAINGAVGAVGSTFGELGNIKSIIGKNSTIAAATSLSQITPNAKTTISIEGNAFVESDILKNIGEMPIERQISLIESTNIKNLEHLDISSLDSRVLSALDKRILSDQNALVTNNITGMEQFDVKKITDRLFSNTDNIKQLSDNNILKLLAGSSDKEKTQILVDEVTRRINDGNLVFDKGHFDYYRFMLGNEDGKILAVSKLPTSVQDQLLQNLENRIKDLPETISSLQVTKFQKVNIGNLLESGKIDNRALNIIKNITETNPSGLKTFNVELLDKRILDDFGTDFAVSMGSHPEIGGKLISLADNNPELYSVYKSIQDTISSDMSLGNQEGIAKSTLNFLYDNSASLKGVDISTTNPHDLLEFSLLRSSINEEYILKGFDEFGFTPDFREKYAEIINNSFTKNYSEYQSLKNLGISSKKQEAKIDAMKNDYFQKYFSMTSTEVDNFISKYGDNLGSISGTLGDADGRRLTGVIDYLQQVKKSTSAEQINELYNSQNFKISREEIIALDEIGRRKYGEVYAQTFSKTSDKINSLLPGAEKHIIDGKEIRIVDAPEGISALVYSSDTGFVTDKSLVNNNYVDTWNSVDINKNHGLSTTFISPSNMGTAPVQNTGVLYGFYDIGAKDIQAMAPYDVNSNIANYGFGTQNKQIYMSPEAMSVNSNRVYNEFVLSRPDSKPSCVMIYDNMDKNLINNAYKAAADWDIPVVRVDKMAIAKNQSQDILGYLDVFNSTKDANALRASVELFESNTSGYGLNITSAGKVDTLQNVTNNAVSNLFNPRDIETSVSEYASYIGKMQNNGKYVDEAIKIFTDVKKSYEITSKNSTGIINETKSLLDLDGIIKTLEGARH